jgi:hypothetical protein
MVMVLLFPTFATALLRVLLARADRHSVWLAFRCLPGPVQGALGLLAVSGIVVMLVSSAGAGNVQSAEIRGGRYFVLDTTPYERRVIEVPESQYVAVLESDQRSMLTIPGLLFAGAAGLSLVAGELRRVDAGSRSR